MLACPSVCLPTEEYAVMIIVTFAPAAVSAIVATAVVSLPPHKFSLLDFGRWETLDDFGGGWNAKIYPFQFPSTGTMQCRYTHLRAQHSRSPFGFLFSLFCCLANAKRYVFNDMFNGSVHINLFVYENAETHRDDRHIYIMANDVRTAENSLIRYILLTYCQHVHIAAAVDIVVVVVDDVITKDWEARVSCLSFFPFQILIHINIFAGDGYCSIVLCL